MATKAGSLLSLDEAKAALGITDDTKDADITALVDGISARMEKALKGGIFVQRSVVEEDMGGAKVREGRGSNKVRLKYGPLVSVTSIVDEDDETIAATEYYLLKREASLVYLIGGWPAPSAYGYTWTATYTAGYADTQANVPDDVKRACKLQLKAEWARKNPDLKSKSFGDVQLTFRDSQDLLPEVEAALAPYVLRVW